MITILMHVWLLLCSGQANTVIIVEGIILPLLELSLLELVLLDPVSLELTLLGLALLALLVRDDSCCII